MKVWILTEEDYESMDIVKVFDSEEKAEKERSYYSDGHREQIRISEFEVE